MRVLERGAGGGTVVLEHQDVLEARVLLEVDHALAIGQQDVGDGVDRQRGQRGRVLR
jgi:hypothetical protein